MTDIMLQSNVILGALEKHLWAGVLQGTLALLLVFAIVRLFSSMPPQTANWLWRLGYLKLLVAFIGLGSIALPWLPQRDAQPVPPPSRATVADRQVGAEAAAADTDPSLPAVSGLETPDLPSSVGAERWSMIPLLMLIWSAGSVWFGVRILAAGRKIRVLRQACRDLEDAEIQAELARLCRGMGIAQIPRLMCGDGMGPLICGFTSPSIILPVQALAECSREELRLMLAHELAHVKRRDLLWGWLPIAAQGLFFFHPLVWLLHKEWRFTQEAACDALAIRYTRASEADYGRMLLNHAAAANPSRQLVAIGIIESYETLKRRLTAMKHFSAFTRRKQLTLAVLIGLFGIVGMLPWVLAEGKSSPAPVNSVSKATNHHPRQQTGLEPLIPALPQDIHLTYQVTTQEFALPKAWINQRIAWVKPEIKKRPNTGLEQLIPRYQSRAVKGAAKTSTAEYWGTMQGFMYTDMNFALAYDGRKVATGAAWYMVPDLIKQPNTVRSGIVITKDLSRVDGYSIPYLGIYQPGRELFDKDVRLSSHGLETYTGEDRWSALSLSGKLKYYYSLGSDRAGRFGSLGIYVKRTKGSEPVKQLEDYQFADYATKGGVTYPSKVIQEKWTWFRGRDLPDKKVVFRVIKAEAKPIPNSFFALATTRPHAQIEDDRYQLPGSSQPWITYNYMNPAQSIDEASARAYQSMLKEKRAQSGLKGGKI